MPLVIDNYIVEQKLGAGGLADVYQARKEGEGPPVALKVLRDATRRGAHLKRFLREGRLLKNLDHPGLPVCYEVVDGERPYLVIEVLVGRTLSETIRGDGPMAPDEILRIAPPVLEVLAYLHSQGVIHRDVKPGNVFLCDDGRVLLMDLGLAADPHDLLTTTLGDVMGTFAYMAPEQIAGAAVDHRSDLYSLGISLYEALVGRRPYRARGATGYLHAHRKGKGAQEIAESAPPGTPAMLVSVVARLMTPDPGARPASATAARALLAGDLLRGELSEPPLVGRAAALGAVEALVDGGGMVQVHGEPGMGLGRVARIAWWRVRERGGEVFALRFLPRTDEAQIVAGLARALERLIGPIEPVPEQVGKALRDQAAESPLMVLLEDLDLAEPAVRDATLRLLEPTGAAVLATSSSASPIEMPGHVVELRALTLGEADRLVAGMLNAAAPPAGLSGRLHRLTNGLPGAIVAGVRDLVERDVLKPIGLDEDGRSTWALEPSAEVGAMAAGWLVNDVVVGLEDDARGLLELLTVAAEEVPLELALKAAELDMGSTAPFRLAASHLVVERDAGPSEEDGPWIGLSRPLVGRLVDTTLSVDRRRELHVRLAASLALLPPSRWRDERLPYHQAHGVPGAHAARALVGLGDWLESREQHRRALDVLMQVDDESPTLDALTATHAALARGEALLALEQWTEAGRALLAARRRAREQGRMDLAGRALVDLGRLQLFHGDATEAERVLKEARGLVSGTMQNPVLPVALLALAESRLHRGEPARAEAGYAKALEVATVQGRPREAASSQLGMGICGLRSGRLDDASVRLSSAVGALRKTGGGSRLAEALIGQGEYLRRVGRIDEAMAAAREAREIAGRLELARIQGLAVALEGDILIGCADLDRAASLLRVHRAAGERTSPVGTRLAWRGCLADLRRARGDHPAALSAHHQCMEDAEKAGWEAERAFHTGMVAILTARGGELTDAIGALYGARHRRLAARLLLEGARLAADPEVLHEAGEEARAAGDLFLRIEVQHATGGRDARNELQAILDTVLDSCSGQLAASLLRSEPARWARRGGRSG